MSVFMARREAAGPMEGMRGCSRLSCIKSAIEYLVHREFHSHKRSARDVSHNLQGWAHERGNGTRARRGTKGTRIKRFLTRDKRGTSGSEEKIAARARDEEAECTDKKG